VLVRPDGIVVSQPAHAWVSGQLARAWGAEGFFVPERFEDFCLAAEQHDVGWADADLAPWTGEDGRPVGFTQLDRERRLAIWRSAPRRVLAQSRFAALLVSLHGSSLLGGDFAREQQPLQERLIEGLDRAEVDRCRRLLLAVDRLSLFLCYGEATEVRDVPAAGDPVALQVVPEGDGFTVDPWPFVSEPVVVGCEGRLLDGVYGSDAELRAALESAPWVPLRWELSRG
jgi:uncharacterized protein DUF3891